MSDFDAHELAAAKDPDLANAYRMLHTNKRSWSAIIFNRIRSLLLELDTLTAQLAELDGENSVMEQSCRDVELAIDDVKAQLAERDKRIAELEAENKQLWHDHLYGGEE